MKPTVVVAGSLNMDFVVSVDYLPAPGETVLLVNIDGTVRAYSNRCPHQASALDEGDLDGETLTCAKHLWEFNAVTGCGINPEDALRAFPRATHAVHQPRVVSACECRRVLDLRQHRELEQVVREEDRDVHVQLRQLGAPLLLIREFDEQGHFPVRAVGNEGIVRPEFFLDAFRLEDSLGAQHLLHLVLNRQAVLE